MSASRDISQKIGWSYSNIYRIYKDESKDSPVITAFEPLKSNLAEIHRLHEELKTILDELELLVKE